MKKFISLFLTMMLVLGLTACGENNGESNSTAGGTDKSNGAEIALIIIAGGTVDDKSFNQGAWEGIQDFAKDKDLTCKYYQSNEDSVEAYLNANLSC